ncbi:MAG: hypothetical protein AMXMBFR84_16940 [Candidatus Hydrogenedentota bacterium]
MDLLQNPFYLLGATSRDNRQRLMELADERSLQQDANECMQARSDLSNPRKRLTAEVAWLPGASPKYAQRVLAWLSKPVQAIPPRETLDSLPPMARSNILASGIQRLARYESETLAEWVVELAVAFDDIELQELCKLINEERIAAGFPEVTDISALESEVDARRRHFRQVIKSALDNLPAKQLVEAVTIAVSTATEDGEEHGPILISDLVDSYEVEAQTFLENEEANIETLVKKLRAMVDAGEPDVHFDPMFKQLAQVVRNWDIVAQPIQVSTKSRGLDHNASHRVAGLVRGLAIHMFNEHGKLEYSQYLTNLIQEVFAEVGEVAERTAEDAEALDEIAEQRVQILEMAKTQAEEWKREITYEADVGTIFKDKLRISPEGIEWKGRRWELDSITRLRWGGTRHSVNGIPTGTTYHIFIGNGSAGTSIELKKEAIYSNFVECLWRAVGVRLLTEYLEGLREGQNYRFGSAVMSDLGMELERKKLFSSNERRFCRWNELVIWNGPGVFCIGKKEDKKLSESFSYQDQDNIHILEAAIRTFWKRGGDRLSNLLQE